MPCASVSEKPTRVSAESLNGGFRSVSRPASSTDDVEHLVPLLLHQLLRTGLEIEAQERLRVRRADVEVPVVRVDGDPVEVRDLALRAEALLQLLELERHVGNRSVQLAGNEVAVAVRAEDLGELLAPSRDELEHQEERDDTGVRLAELAEVVVARYLAAENGRLLAHPVLDEGVADAVDERRAT